MKSPLSGEPIIVLSLRGLDVGEVFHIAGDPFHFWTLESIDDFHDWVGASELGKPEHSTHFHGHLPVCKVEKTAKTILQRCRDITERAKNFAVNWNGVQLRHHEIRCINSVRVRCENPGLIGFLERLEIVLESGRDTDGVEAPTIVG